MFKNKRKYQQDEINKWIKQGKRINKVKLAKKLAITRPTLDKLLSSVSDKSFTTFKRAYANNRIANNIRDKLFKDTISFLDKINSHRKETTFIPTFKTLKPYIDKEKEVSLRTYQNIIKENNFYLPWCSRKTKRDINKRIKQSRKKSVHTDLLDTLDDIKIQKKFKRKYFPFGDTIEIDACDHPWFGDEKVHLYRAVDAGTGVVLSEHVEKEETSMGYIVLLKKLLKKYGKPRLVVADKRKSFWNGHDNKSQISLILNEIDIEIITSSDPTSKPNVERSFLDSQQWLPLELFNQKIFTIKKFNEKIDILTIKHNKRFNKNTTDGNSFLPISKEEIDENLNLWLYRKVTSGNTISINGEHYIPVNNGKRIIFEDNAKIRVLSNDKIKYFVIWRGKKIKLEVLNEKYLTDYSSKEWSKIEFEKRKQTSFNKMIDLKQLKLEKKEKELRNLLMLIKKEKEQIIAL